MITNINEIQVNDIIKLRAGDIGIVTLFYDELYLNIDGVISPMPPFNNEFTIQDDSDFDIMVIYRPSTAEELEQQNWTKAPVVWQREPVKMTVDEISKQLGYEVEVVE